MGSIGRLVMLGLVLFAGCAGKTASSSSGAPSGGQGSATTGSGCEPGAELTGAAYDVSKSRFGFGGAPTAEPWMGGTRWVGPDGVVAIGQNGSALGSLNSGAPESARPGWNGNGDALKQHVIDYFGAMGLAACQVQRANLNGVAMGGGPVGSPGTTTPLPSVVSISRAVDGIAVFNSMANAQFDVDDQTTDETLYWPTIPADVVSAARAFRDRMKDPAQLAAYRAKLAANAQGDGEVMIAHTSSFSQEPFRALAVWYVPQPYGVMFDVNGAPAPLM